MYLLEVINAAGKTIRSHNASQDQIQGYISKYKQLSDQQNKAVKIRASTSFEWDIVPDAPEPHLKNPRTFDQEPPGIINVVENCHDGG